MQHLQSPDPMITSRISTRLEELGVVISSDVASVVIAATLEWLTKTNSGKEHIVNLFGFDFQTGSSDKLYYLADTGDMVNGDDIYFLNTVVAKGRFIPPSYVDVGKIDKIGCDECGIQAHCAKNVEGHSVCNHCLTASDNPGWRDKGGGRAECEGCTVYRCEHNPRKNKIA